MEQARVQHQILLRGEFAIERKRLRHVAHAAAGVDIGRIYHLPKECGCAFAGGQQAREHFHGGGFAAAVGAQKAKDFTAADAKADVINSHKATKAHG